MTLIFGPTFGYEDIEVVDHADTTDSYASLGCTYECPPGVKKYTFFTGSKNFRAAEIEVFSLSQSSTQNKSSRKRDFSTAQLQHNTEQWESATFDEYPRSVKAALRTEQQMLIRVKEELKGLKDAFQQEKEIIEFYAIDNSMEVIMLNVSGELMSIRKDTLCLCKESVLAKHFSDPLWVKGVSDGVKSVEKWNEKEVATWISNIDGLSEDAAMILKNQNMNGIELLSLNSNWLMLMGITRLPTLELLAKEIRNLKKGGQGEGFLIEQSSYCFGKILDQLWLHALCSAFHHMAPLPPPTIREPYRKRFKRIVEYYFPTDSSLFE